MSRNVDLDIGYELENNMGRDIDELSDEEIEIEMYQGMTKEEYEELYS